MKASQRHKSHLHPRPARRNPPSIRLSFAERRKYSLAILGFDTEGDSLVPNTFNVFLFLSLASGFTNAALTLIALRHVVRLTSYVIHRARHRSRRSSYYALETDRRRALAAERRKIRRRTTENPCPTPEQIMAAWEHVKDSKASMLAFGGMLHDLECYVDNQLRFNGRGRICGRNAGVKGWLRRNTPELYRRYTTVMRYKAAAKKLRQIVELRDPVPLSRILPDGLPLGVTPDITVVRAVAVYHEALDGYERVTPTIVRIDALLDPARTESAALARWRERFKGEIGERNLRGCWKRLSARMRRRGRSCAVATG